jgi:BirA family transcriptional regulator, biotin operon repressor / biotin---[acetyl-CoA-carboxylase] ligase
VSAPAPRSTSEARPALGRPRLHLRSTDSTNERARELAIAGAPHGTLVTAAEQSAGRGRQGRRWSAPAGSSILMSLLLRSPPRLLPLMAAVAVCDVAGEEARIKWPNDVVVAREHAAAGPGLGKLAGILVEARPQQGWAVLGIGLNVAVRLEQLPPELHPDRFGASANAPAGLPAATMGLERVDVEPTLTLLIASLERRLAGSDGATLEAWRSRDALLGREIAWSDGRGRAEGIDGEGRLVVALSGGGHTALGAGEVHLESIA